MIRRPFDGIVPMFVIVLLAVSLTGCGWFDRKVAVFTGHSVACIEGVKYLEFSSGASVAYDRDGKVKQC